MSKTAIVAGAGVFGVTAALELGKRGWSVTLIDPGPLPHPLAASTDISKIVRLDYGADDFYTAHMERALEGWRTYNARFERRLFHETGFAVLASEPLREGSFELDSFRCVGARGHALHRLDRTAIAQRFPAWSAKMSDGYYNPQGGWAESAAVIAALVGWARDAGVQLVSGAITALSESDAGIDGVVCDGQRIAADRVVVAAGAWTPTLVPSLAPCMRIIGQPVLHFAPSQPELFSPPAFVPWAADIGRTGWYGFCSNADGVVKIANHGPGVPIDPSAERHLPPDSEARFRAFLRAMLPALAEAPVVGQRLCLYCDSFDGDLWIDRHPEQRGLVVAAGGSGHGFKFAPLLGGWIADTVEDAPSPSRFKWRDPTAPRFEQARFSGD